MEIQIESLSDILKRLNVIVPVERIDKILAEHLKKQSATPETIAQDAWTEVLQTSFAEALHQAKLMPVGEPSIELINAKPGTPFQYSATFEVLPIINNIQFDKTGIQKAVKPVTEEEIDESIEHLRALHVEWKEVDEPLEDLNQAIIDFSGTIDGVPLEDSNATDYEIVIGSSLLLPGFEEGLLGAKPGEERILNLKFPDDYFSAEVAGKPVQFKVIIKKVSKPVLPPVTEYFIKNAGIPSGKKSDLIDKVRMSLERDHEEIAKDNLKQQVFDRLIELNDFPVPTTLIEEEKYNLLNENQSLDNAERNVRISLIMGALLDQYKLEPEPQRVEAQIKVVASLYKDPEERTHLIKNDKNKMLSIETLALEEQIIEKLLS